MFWNFIVKNSFYIIHFTLNVVFLNIYTFLQTNPQQVYTNLVFLLCYTTYTSLPKIVLRVDRGELRDFQKEGGKRAMDANIVDALIADFEHEDLFTHGSSGVEGLSGDAQRCMHLAGML